MAGELYRKPIVFALLATVVILIGTIVTMFYPMLTPQMHPKLEALKPYTALQLAGRDIYQREGCNNCHTQTVRPLKSEVMRYGEYSKAGEFAYDHPFLWGSKRTGPDLARIGGKYADEWHLRHFENPRAFFAESNMPSYGWLKDYQLNPSEAEAHMKALKFPYSAQEISALSSKTELDALVAYIQVIGTAVSKRPVAEAKAPVKKEHEVNPLAGNPKAITEGKELFKANCAVCHGAEGKGDIAPSLLDDVFLYVKGDLPDDDYFEIIHNGTSPGMVEEGRTAKGGMPGFGQTLDKNKIWALVAYIRSMQGK
ncbi:MAG: cbb3-type cytochrome c oxidase subunit II [Candidatus Tectomicrobia bacterium]|uniref:Cbb3-type cytochrome c oxidase subunit II n=1 Tax=Tectimicrobiota bacterium TaxID=2528274 RepID=A0A933GL87_UNCTE|nr:cbb3-type cytochrome c oxidase subunit II [Candidatus Tectomicrobia bacterium]